MLFVVDVDAARIALRARAIRCPQYGCSGRLRPWSPARVRTVTRWPGELVRLAPDRGMCVVCRVSQTLLPAWYVPRRSASIEVVGAVVSAFVNYGHRPNRIAEVLRMPRSTVRGWVHRLPEASPVLQQLTARIVVEIGVDVPQPEVPSRPPCTPGTQGLALALDHLARTAWGLTQPDPAHTAAGAPTGIDYIHLLGQAHRREANWRLRLVDPSHARTGLGLWPAINLGTGGRLLNMINAGSDDP